jgi:hypothetical protein
MVIWPKRSGSVALTWHPVAAPEPRHLQSRTRGSIVVTEATFIIALRHLLNE